MMILVIILILVLHPMSAQIDYDPLSDGFINEVNKHATTWTAGRNFPANLSKIILNNIIGQRILPNVKANLSEKPFGDKKTRAHIPEFFDARIKWPHCPTLWDIRDQGACGACWAITAAATISDRICIHSNGTIFTRISTEHLLSCVQGFSVQGCGGADPTSAWYFWFSDGVVSGGPYGSNEGCMPFSIPPVKFGPIKPKTPKCKNYCTNKRYETEFENDRHFAQVIYAVLGGVIGIQLEIMRSGPVAAAFEIYEDFIHYKKGVYQHVYGHQRGGHVVKMMGWGVENGTPYWLIANSFNASWGDSGYVKFLRGTDHCGIESNLMAGLPEDEDIKRNLTNLEISKAVNHNRPVVIVIIFLSTLYYTI